MFHTHDLETLINRVTALAPILLYKRSRMSAQLIQLKDFRKEKHRQREFVRHKTVLEKLSKHELLEEMVNYHDAQKQAGEMTYELLFRGMALFELLEIEAETRELQILSRSFRRHLEYEWERMKA